MKAKSKFQQYVYNELIKIAGHSSQNKDLSSFGPDIMAWLWFYGHNARFDLLRPYAKRNKSVVIDKPLMLALADKATELGCTSYLLQRKPVGRARNNNFTCILIPPDQLATAELNQITIWCPAQQS